MKEGFDTKNCSVVEGKLALPYMYFAGRVGSRFLTTLRDEKKILGIKCSRCKKVLKLKVVSCPPANPIISSLLNHS